MHIDDCILDFSPAERYAVISNPIIVSQYKTGAEFTSRLKKIFDFCSGECPPRSSFANGVWKPCKNRCSLVARPLFDDKICGVYQ